VQNLDDSSLNQPEKRNMRMSKKYLPILAAIAIVIGIDSTTREAHADECNSKCSDAYLTCTNKAPKSNSPTHAIQYCDSDLFKCQEKCPPEPTEIPTKNSPSTCEKTNSIKTVLLRKAKCKLSFRSCQWDDGTKKCSPKATQKK
jgi:hypothetical protein